MNQKRPFKWLLKLVVLAVFVSVFVGFIDDVPAASQMTIHTNTSYAAGSRYNRNPTTKTFTMNSRVANMGWEWSRASADIVVGPWGGMMDTDGVSSPYYVETPIYYSNDNGSSTLNWNTSNFLYCIHNRKRSPSTSNNYTAKSYANVAGATDSSHFLTDSAIKDSRTKEGLLIILQNGFPVKTAAQMGLTAGTNTNQRNSDAYSATAMAVKMWMSERERDLNEAGTATYLWNYNIYDQKRSGYGTITPLGSGNTLTRNTQALAKARSLVTLARKGTGKRNTTLTLGSASTAHTSSNFVYKFPVSMTDLSEGFTVNRSGLPSAATVSPMSGKSNTTITVTIPKTAAHGGKNYSIRLDGLDKGHVNSFLYTPIPGKANVGDGYTHQGLAGIFGEPTEVPKSNTRSFTTPQLPPDLHIPSISTNKTIYNPGETVTVTTNIKNIGYTTSSRTTMTIKRGSTTVGTRSVPTIAAGRSWGTQTFTFTAPSPTSTTTYTINASIPSGQSPTGTTSRSTTITVRGKPE